MRTARFYFDFISHNAWLAWRSLPALAERYELEIEPIPVLFAGLLQSGGQLGPAEIPPKLRWMHRDVLRKATRLGIPLAPPAEFPFHPLASLRVSSLPWEPEEHHRVIDALFSGAWAESRTIGRPETVAEILDDVTGDGQGALERAGQPVHKGRLRTQTDDAIACGVFGVPTIEVDGELFWGFDDFTHLELFLRGEDPLDEEAFNAWQRVPRAAERSPKPG